MTQQSINSTDGRNDASTGFAKPTLNNPLILRMAGMMHLHYLHLHYDASTLYTNDQNLLTRELKYTRDNNQKGAPSRFSIT